MNTVHTELTSGQVTSRDGTEIGYLTTGSGPAVVLLHGSNESARSHLGLARALADKFTVYLPDRRGRGLSGPHRQGHDMATEVDDLTAVLDMSGAQRVFGVSVGGMIVLAAARNRPQLHKVAVYEPALVVDGESQLRWVERFDREMAEGKVSAALVTSMFGVEMAPAVFKLVPRRWLAALTDRMLAAEERKATPDTITMRTLAPTLRYEGLLLAEMAGTAETFAEVAADVLIMAGSKGLAGLRTGTGQLAAAFPHVRRVEFPGLDHGGSSDVSVTNRAGKPEIVAAELRDFLA